MTVDERRCVVGIKPRGRTYWMRRRVPAEYASVENRTVVEVPLKTRDPAEAQARAYYRWEALKKGWNAAATQKRGAATPEAFDAMQDLLADLDLSYLPLTTLVSGPIEKLISRIEAVANADPASPYVSAALGAVDLPHVLVSEMPKIIEEIIDGSGAPMNARQRSASSTGTAMLSAHSWK